MAPKYILCNDATALLWVFPRPVRLQLKPLLAPHPQLPEPASPLTGYLTCQFPHWLPYLPVPSLATLPGSPLTGYLICQSPHWLPYLLVPSLATLPGSPLTGYLTCQSTHWLPYLPVHSLATLPASPLTCYLTYQSTRHPINWLLVPDYHILPILFLTC